MATWVTLVSEGIAKVVTCSNNFCNLQRLLQFTMNDATSNDDNTKAHMRLTTTGVHVAKNRCYTLQWPQQCCQSLQKV